MHREGERRRAAARGDLEDGVADLAIAGAAAGELGGHEGFEEALLLETLIALGHEAVVGIVPRGRLGDVGGDAIGAGEPVGLARADVARADVAGVDPGDGCG